MKRGRVWTFLSAVILVCFLSQVDDLGLKYSISGVTAGSSLTESRRLDLVWGSPWDVPAHFLEAGPSGSPMVLSDRHGGRGAIPHREQSPPPPSFPPPSPPDLALAGLSRPSLNDLLTQGGSPLLEPFALR